MKESRKFRIYRKILFATGICMLVELATPTAALALTSGPAQPEFSSFEPVATTNMVSDFSGDFTYNLPVLDIPGANGGGYALSLSYHSGASPEEEASWVGYGWTLNPGSISRNKRGLPDDDKGTTVKYWNMTTPNRTVGVSASANAEAFSIDIPFSVNGGLRYNNYKGFGYTAGLGVKLASGIVSLGYNISDGDGSFSVRVNPAAILSHIKKREKEDDNTAAQRRSSAQEPSQGKNKEEETAKRAAALRPEKQKQNAFSGTGVFTLTGSNYGIFSFNDVMRAPSVAAYKGSSFNVSASLLGAVTPLQLGPVGDISGSYSYQVNVNKNGDSDAADERSVYGYMYSDKAPYGQDENVMMDYYMEKLNPYDKQDKYLGIPFSNADNYVLSGEGLGGGFRMYNKRTGHFRPNSVTSKMNMYNLSVEVEAGLNLGGGGDLGVGFQRLRSNGWDDATIGAYNFADSTYDENVFFRFTNDMGGQIDYGNDNLEQAKISGGGVPGAKSFTPNMTGISDIRINSGYRVGRSSYVAYHTNREMLDSSALNYKKYYSYTQSNDINDLVDRSSVRDGIGEISVFNEAGMRYVYGLPVYARNEINLQYDLKDVPANDILNNYLAYRDIDLSNLKSKIGEEREAPYATSFLLTDITSPDYIDRTMDGPTDDDFGGYTRFSYARSYGSKDKNLGAGNWYRWRMPYNGLQYNKGELSTQMDDMGSVSAGEKEVYYLDTVMTKTHFAVFRTSSRNDGYSAEENSTAANSKTAKGSQQLKRLDRIDLYAKNNGSPQLVKSVRFEYDYTLSAGTVSGTGLPNSSGYATGKLTLKRVWFEYEGVANAKISPYVFQYAYSTVTYPSKYQSTMGNYGSGLTQNPSFNSFDIDAWGNYQYNGAARFLDMKSWVNQAPDAAFDPAAWQLKVIKLPTGGEIHVQYEQDDYAYVQDKPVHAMASLKSGSNDLVGRYYINLAELGLSETTANRNAVRKLINDLYVVPQKKIYFKFLYRLLGTDTPLLTDCSSEYITGYCNVKSTGVSSTDGVYVNLGDPGIGNSDFSVPITVCQDFVRTQRAGNLNTSGNCNPSVDGLGNSNDPKDIVMNLLNFIGTNLAPDHTCLAVNFPLSYLRIPIPVAKKGGGVRVKRILMYDKGMETGDASLYGNEYEYKLEDGTSSGVATNEPSSIREENALVEFDEKYKQSFLSKIIAGRDKEQAELPLGESILPGPSVGYSRVVIKNIHSGKTNPGFIVKEFFTAKDYPMQVDYTTMDTKKDYLPIPGGLINYFVNNFWVSQGFLFKLNNMHGQPRSEATYAGDPSDITDATLASKQEFTYYEPGEQIPVMGSLNSITLANPGKEMEMVFESRGMEDVTHDVSVEFDVDVGIALIPLPFGSITPSYTYNESKMYSHTTTKVIQYPAIQKSVLSYADGIYHLSENVAFSPVNGQPVLTRTTDGYDLMDLQQSSDHSGKYYNYTFPAASEYKSMGQKAVNERISLKSNPSSVMIEKMISGSDYWLDFTAASGYSVCDVMGKLYPGDLIKLTQSSSPTTLLGFYNVKDSISGNKLFILPNAIFGGSSSGSGQQVNIEVIRSGRTNQLNTSVGSITTYGDSARFNAISSGGWRNKVLLAARLDSVLHLASGPRVLPASKIPSGISIKNDNTGGCDALNSYDIEMTFVNPDSFFLQRKVPGGSTNCEYGYFRTNGNFGVDEYTGEISFFELGNLCHGTPVPCLKACPSLLSLAKVISASAQTFSDNWNYDNAIYEPYSLSNSYENGAKGKWRVTSSYVYKDTIIGANTGNQRNYKDAGVFTMVPFSWRDTSLIDSHWIKLNTVTKYSPDGNALEEQDILGIYSTAKFGYDKTQPYLVAKNADYQSVQFDGFEKTYNSSTQLEDAWSPGNIATKRNTTYAHSGRASWTLVNGDSIGMKQLTVSQQMLDYGLSLKVWVRDVSANPGTPLRGGLQGSASYQPLTFTKVARTGEWTLYEAKATGMNTYFSTSSTVVPYIVNNYAGQTLWIDDIRLQPLDAQVITYVYDTSTLRLIASFDDQHFGLFYQYNAEGKLVRKLIETERGIKTVTETQYHVPQTTR